MMSTMYSKILASLKTTELSQIKMKAPTLHLTIWDVAIFT